MTHPTTSSQLANRIYSSVIQNLQARWVALTYPLIQLQDRQTEHNAFILASLLFAVTIILAIFLPLRSLLETQSPAREAGFIISLSTIGALFISYLLARRGHHQRVLRIMLGVGYVAIYSATLTAGNISALYYLAVLFLFASLFLRLRVVIGAFTANVVVIGLFILLRLPQWDGVEVITGPVLFNLVMFLIMLTFSWHRSQLEAFRKADLVESESRYRQIGELIADFAYSIRVQTDGQITWEWLTESFQKVTGATPTEFDATLRQVIHPDDAERAIADMHEVINTDTDMDSEYRMHPANGQTRWLRVYRRPLWDEEQQRVTRVFAVAKDITEQKHAHAHELEFALQRDRLDIVGRFVQAISHDFRTSLAIIETNRYLIPRRLNAEAREQVQHYINTIQHYVKRLTEQMESLYTVSSLTTLQTEQRHLARDLSYIITEYVFITDARDISLLTEIDATLPPVQINIKETKHALRCLLDNAIVYTPPGGSITIKAYCEAKYVAVAIEDTGRGIEPEHLPFIFDLFYRADAARSLETGGIGLGLSIVQMIAHAQGGKVTVSSEVGKGSIFTLWLPLALQSLPIATNGLQPSDAPPSPYSSRAS